MVKNKHDLVDGDKSSQKRRTKILEIIGRRGPISVADMEKDPNLDRRYIQTILKDLAPEDDKILNQRLFCWHELLTIPKDIENKLMEKVEKILPNKNNISINSGSKEIGDGKFVVHLRIIQKQNWIKFQIEYDRKKVVASQKESEKPVFRDDSFKVTRFNGAKERSFNYAFRLYRKAGKLYVYSTVYSNRDLRTCVNKILEGTKEEEIKEQLIEKIAQYMKENSEVISITSNSRATLRAHGIDPISKLTDASKELLDDAGLQIAPRKTMLITSVASRKEPLSKKINRIMKSVIDKVVRIELDKLKIKPRWWIYSLNARGLMEYCLTTKSESRISKVIENLSIDPKYRYYHYNRRFQLEDDRYYIQAFFESFRDVKFNRVDDREVIREQIMTKEKFWAMIKKNGYAEADNDDENLEETKVSLKVADLDFPFLLYHDEMIKAKILSENFVAIELKQIAKRLRGLNDDVPLSELIYQVTHHYYKDFEFLINSKPILGMKSCVEEIRAKDTNLYKMIMNYQITVLSYIKSVKERKVHDANDRLSILTMSLEEEPKPRISIVARMNRTGIELINESNH
jgi:hypothetical protein